MFLAPFSSDQRPHAAGAAGFRQARTHAQPQRRTFAAESTPCERNVPANRNDCGGALGRSAAGSGGFSASTRLAEPYSDLYQAHQRLRAELGK